MRAVKALAKRTGDTLLIVTEFSIDLEKRKKAAFDLAAHVGVVKFGDLLVRYEPHAEWIALAIAAGTYGLLMLEGFLTQWLHGPAAPAPVPVAATEEGERGPDGEPMKKADAEVQSIDDPRQFVGTPGNDSSSA